MAETVHLILPLPPNIANGRLHWRTKDRKRKAYEELANYWTVRERPPESPMAKATIRATLYVPRQMDGDNLVARMKWAVDWLVKAGYLVDDGPNVLDWTMPEQVVDRNRQRVEITLEAAA